MADDDGEVLTDDLGVAAQKDNDLDFDNVFSIKTDAVSDKKEENTFSFDTPAEDKKEEEPAASNEEEKSEPTE